ncbi:MAG: alpha/beta hydrolase [Spirochaetes bacterium]|nr:alpha/beta hydrolase [Spirochaetota bacterium]
MKIKTGIIYSIIVSAFISCSFLSIDNTDSMRVKHSTVIDAKDYPENNTAVILGSVTSVHALEQPILITVCSANPLKDGKSRFAGHILLNHTKEFMIYLPEGEYFLYAILDLNNDYIFEDKETAGFYGKPDKISLLKNEIKSGIIIPVGALAQPESIFPERLSVQHKYNSVEYTTYNGQVRKIYSEIFSSDNAKIGWWHPSLFMKAFGANIYLTEKYDPDKMPVLFIHGAQGSPYDWAHVYVHLDKNKFQPLFFYYPSGLRLPMLSELLYIRMKDLQQKYKFKEIYMAAHSMGGLVSRSMLTNYYKKNDKLIKLYVTFATPWSGFEFADAAMKTAPYVLPSWIDVSSHSMFIKTTLDRSIPLSVDYYLFFGKYDKTSKNRALDSRVYKDAKGIFGFNADHNTILTDKESLVKFNEILNQKI